MMAGVVTTLSLVSCSTAGSSASGSQAACDSPGVTPTAVKVGLIYPDTGVGAGAFGAARAGVDAKIGLVNASGGVNGRKIVLDWQDDQSNQSGFNLAAQGLLANDGVFGLIAETLSVSGYAAQLDQQGIPVAGLPAEPAWTQHRNMFTFGAFPSSATPITTFGLYAQQQQVTRAVLVNEPTARSVNAVGEMFVDSLRDVGIQVVDQIDYTPKITDLSQVAARIRRDGADALLGPLPVDDFVAVYEAARVAGTTFKMALNGAGDSPDVLAKYGSGIAGMSVLVGYTPFSVDNAGMRQYRQAMADYAPEFSGAEDAVALASYVTADEFVTGLQKAGACPTRQAFIDNLRAVTSYNADGLIPTTDLSRFRLANRCYSFVRVNQAGTSFDVVQDPGASDPNQWCGA
jgi:ABC-type branched-subunit amino acid transport system substrate-binding protein